MKASEVVTVPGWRPATTRGPGAGPRLCRVSTEHLLEPGPALAHEEGRVGQEEVGLRLRERELREGVVAGEGVEDARALPTQVAVSTGASLPRYLA